jgi:uncharacterized protein with GYD domain
MKHFAGGADMETYVVLMKYTGSAQEVDFDRPDNADKKIVAALEAVGGKLIQTWATLGRYDTVVIAEVPDAKAIRAVVAATPREISSETLRAFPGMTGSDDPEFESKLKKVLSALQEG